VLDLRSTPLAGKPLAEALTGLARGFTSATGVPVEVQADSSLPPLPLRTEAELFRIAQEALTNVRKHARARSVKLTLRRRGGAVVLTLEDDGRGFSPRSPSSGQGVIGMRERARLVGGTLHITSARDRGTRVTARVPLSASA